MSFSDNFIKKPVLTTVCSILIVLIGVIAIPTLPIASLPNIANPLIQIILKILQRVGFNVICIAVS